MELDRIYHGDCASMPAIDDNSIDFILSGPPYWDYIDYDAYLKGEDFVWQQPRPYDEFLAGLSLCYKECYRVLAPGRCCIINLGTVRRKGRCYPLPFHAVPIIEKLGFEFCYEIIWHKVSGGRPHARNFIQRPYPGCFIPNNRTEYLLVFRKEPAVPFLRPGQVQTREMPLDDLFKKEIANNVWHIMPACYPYHGKHPCPFPPEIPLRLIPLFSLPGEIVLDPFMGVGTTARACRMLGRKFIGYEKESKFIEAAMADIDVPLPNRRPVKWGKMS